MQTSYSVFMQRGLRGSIADLGNASVCTGKIKEGVEIPFGIALQNDDANIAGFFKPYAGGVVNGVSVRDLSLESNGENDPVFVQGNALVVLNQGRIWGPVDEDATPQDSVFVRYRFFTEVFTITFSANFVSLNVINGDVGGVAIAPVTYASSHALTFAAVVAAIEDTGVVTVESSDATARTITCRVVSDSADVDPLAELSATTDFVVTLGASQATDSVAQDFAPSKGTESGAFLTGADAQDGNATAVAFPKARFVESSAEGRVLLEINIP